MRVLAGHPAGAPAQLLIQFRDPCEFFSAQAFAQARQSGHISAAVCGRTRRSWDAPRYEQGCMMGSRTMHVGRDTDGGCVLRSHFFQGHDLPASGLTPGQVEALVPVIMGQALLQHCCNEFSFLSRFLPSLFIAESRATHPVKLPC